MSAQARLSDLLTLTERLTGALEAETAAFEAHRPHDAALAAPESARLANLYRQESARLRREPELLTISEPALRTALLAATERFNAALARHGRAVAAAKTVTEGLVEAVAREVARLRASPVGYGAAGRAGGGNYAAVTLNRSA